MVGSKAFYPPEGLREQNEGDDQAFQMPFAEPPSSPANASEWKTES